MQIRTGEKADVMKRHTVLSKSPLDVDHSWWPKLQFSSSRVQLYDFSFNLTSLTASRYHENSVHIACAVSAI
jgi:hypothetical protein